MIFISEDGKEIGTIEGGEIVTEDVQLDSLFYQLMDEGIPTQRRPGVVSYQDATPARIISYLRTQGYEARSGEKAEDANEDEAVLENVNFQGLRINIENLRGDVRHGKTFH